MQYLKYIICILFLFGCNKYKVINKRHQIINNYSKENIYITNYILCNNARNVWNLFEFKGKYAKISEDSVFKMFQNSIIKLNLPVVVNNDLFNICDSTFHSNHHLKVRKINLDKILRQSDVYQGDKLWLVPIIYLDNLYQKHIYFSSRGIPGGGEYLRDTFLNIAIYIISLCKKTPKYCVKFVFDSVIPIAIGTPYNQKLHKPCLWKF